jgi:hypothetical protein
MGGRALSRHFAVTFLGKKKKNEIPGDGVGGFEGKGWGSLPEDRWVLPAFWPSRSTGGVSKPLRALPAMG